jgi:threonyl-tRNA synthetase
MPDSNNGSIQITLPDGSRKAFQAGTTLAQIAEAIGPGLARAALAGKVDGQAVDLNCAVERDASVELLTFSSDEGREVYWHSTAHIMAQAVQNLYPDTKVTIGPPIESGFYYDFDREKPFTPEELEAIESRMKEIVGEDQAFERVEVTREEALELFADLKEPYKVEILNEIEPGETISVYRNASGWCDLCRGPHVPGTSKVKVFKLLSSSGAYWRGDESNKMLQRIYGVSFPDKKALKAHLDILEEAKRRDHRTLGRQLDLFSIDDSVGPGLVLWHPKGARIRTEIENFWRQAHFEGDYDLVASPHRQIQAVGNERAPRLLSGGHVLSDGHRRAGVLRQAHELPVPQHDLQEQAPQLPGAPFPLGRDGHGLQIRACRRPARPAAGPWLHAGRRPHLLSAGPGRR